jgi:hypothetical protein
VSDPGQGRFEVEYTPTDDLLRLQFGGRLTLDLMNRGQDTANGLTAVTAQTRVLIVCVDVELDEIDIHTLTDHQAYKASKRYPTHRTALVVGDKPGHRALAELWAVTRDGGKAGGAGVFSNEVSATEWLLSGHYAEHPHKFVNENIIPL